MLFLQEVMEFPLLGGIRFKPGTFLSRSYEVVSIFLITCRRKIEENEHTKETETKCILIVFIWVLLLLPYN